MRTLSLVVAGVVGLAGSAFADAPAAIGSEEITTGAWKVTAVGSTVNAPNGLLKTSEWSPNESRGEAAFSYATNSTFSSVS